MVGEDKGIASDVDLFSNLDGIIDLDPEVANSALDLGMPEQELDSA